jgi:predicted amidophosphoribosyltransferase
MAISIFFLLALIAGAFIAYPLLPGRTPIVPATVVTDGDIEQAVRHLRRSRRGRGEGLACPTCGQGYRTGDLFCVRCGTELPQGGTAAGTVCPSCGAGLRGDEQFCSRCGQALAQKETP